MQVSAALVKAETSVKALQGAIPEAGGAEREKKAIKRAKDQSR